MKVTGIHIKGNKNLILFFNGWGMDDRAIFHLPDESFDIIMLNEYHSLDFQIPELSKYESVYVIAWSLGVWVANYILQNLHIKPKKTIAINGTIHAIDDGKGIPARLFQSTIDNWDETGRTKFQLRMFKDRLLFANNINKLPVIKLSEQKEELIALQSFISRNESSPYRWDRIFIGSDDLIFTTQNQKESWFNYEYKIIKMPHFPFIEFTSWSNLIG